MTIEARRSVELSAAAINAVPEEKRPAALQFMETFAAGLAAGIEISKAAANAKEEKQ